MTTLLSIYPDHGKRLLSFLSERDKSAVYCTCKVLSKKIYNFVQNRQVTLREIATQQSLSGNIVLADDSDEELNQINYHLLLDNTLIGRIKLELPENKAFDTILVYRIDNFLKGVIARVGTELMKTAIRESFNRGLEGRVTLHAHFQAPPFYWKLRFSPLDDKPLGAKYPKIADISPCLALRRQELDKSLGFSAAVEILKKEQEAGNKPAGIIDAPYVEAHWYWNPTTQPQSTATRSDLFRLFMQATPLPSNRRHWGKVAIEDLHCRMYLPKESILHYKNEFEKQ